MMRWPSIVDSLVARRLSHDNAVFYWVFYRVLPSPEFSPNFIRIYWVLLGFTGFYWVLLGFIGFYWVLFGFTGFYQV